MSSKWSALFVIIIKDCWFTFFFFFLKHVWWNVSHRSFIQKKKKKGGEPKWAEYNTVNNMAQQNGWRVALSWQDDVDIFLNYWIAFILGIHNDIRFKQICCRTSLDYWDYPTLPYLI